jgi:citrate lyase subunit beta/citryl-CoA lyase
MTGALPGPALLFCPADRPDRFQKAVDAADLVVLDLEDAVADPDKEAARRALRITPIDPDRVIVRINPVGTAHHERDLEVLSHTRYRRVMLAKTETVEDLYTLARWQVIALCETARGVLNAPAIAAAAPVIALMWGAEDLIASIGGRSSRRVDGGYRDVARHARSRVLLAAAAAGLSAIDSVYLNFGDLDGLAAEAEDAAASGFSLKACIHPSQVPVVRQAFRPDANQLEWALEVLAAAHAGGVHTLGGQMIDAPLVRQAEAITAAAARFGESPGSD